MAVHAFNPGTGRQKQMDLYGFEANLIYKSSSRTVKAVSKT